MEMAKINGYTPLAVASGNVINGIFAVDFGKLATTQSLVSVVDAGSGEVVHEDEALVTIDAIYGANLSVKASGAATGSVKVFGYDYMGQPMVESFTLNGTTAVVGKKAFKFIHKVITNAGAAVTVTVDRGLQLGLPYRTAKILVETRDGVASTTTTLVAPVNTAQTATSSDPRGLANLTTYSSPAHVVLICVASPEIFVIEEEEVGGLFGIPHYSE